MKKILLKIEGMHCTSCAFNIDGELEDTQGVKSAATNYAKQVSEVEYDEKIVDVDNIKSIVEALGYTTKLENK